MIASFERFVHVIEEVQVMRQRQMLVRSVRAVLLLVAAFFAGSQYARAQVSQPRQAATIGPTAYAAMPPEISQKARLFGFQVDREIGAYRLAFQDEDGTVKVLMVTFAPGLTITGERPVFSQMHVFVPAR
jgi:hypothetical protein